MLIKNIYHKRLSFIKDEAIGIEKNQIIRVDDKIGRELLKSPWITEILSESCPECSERLPKIEEKIPEVSEEIPEILKNPVEIAESSLSSSFSASNLKKKKRSKKKIKD